MVKEPKVRRTVIVVEILSPGAAPLAFDSLEDLGWIIDNGSAIGQTSVMSSAVLTNPEVIHAYLIGMGNDGTFFD